MVPGAMAPSNGHPSGWRSLTTSSVTMVYVSLPTECLPLLTLRLQFFWISYDDLLKKYQHFDRTRLFGPEWTITQQWTSLNVPWSADYHTTKFKLNVTKPGPVILVLSQVSLNTTPRSDTTNMKKLDTRYFKGLIGEYNFVLKFRLQREGENDYIVRSVNNCLISRSTNAEVDLEPGAYHILMKITAYRQHDAVSTEDAVRELAPTRREKLVQIGLSYDLAHAKGIVIETEAEREEREEHDRQRKAAERKRLRDETKKRLQREWIREQKLMARRMRADERLAAKASRLHINGKSSEPEAERVLEDSPVESPSDLNGHTNGVATKPLKNGSVPSIKFDETHTLPTPSSSLDTFSTHTSRHRSTNSISRQRRHTRNRDAELLEGFEFDSEIDMPPEEPVTRALSTQTSFCGDLASQTDPWNAVCVVGMRVYSKDEMLSLEVVRPAPDFEPEAALDMDDPAVSATSEKGSRLLAMQFE